MQTPARSCGSPSRPARAEVFAADPSAGLAEYSGFAAAAGRRLVSAVIRKLGATAGRAQEPHRRTEAMAQQAAGPDRWSCCPSCGRRRRKLACRCLSWRYRHHCSDRLERTRERVAVIFIRGHLRLTGFDQYVIRCVLKAEALSDQRIAAADLAQAELDCGPWRPTAAATDWSSRCCIVPTAPFAVR